MRLLSKSFGLAFLCFPLLFVASCSTVPITEEDRARINNVERAKLEVIQLLSDENFSELDRRVHEIQKRIRNGEATASAYSDFFSAFKRIDPTIAGPLKRWRERNPKSFAPHLAFGLYSASLGWVMRGERYIYLTSKERLEQMGLFFDQAVVSLRNAIEIEPRLSEAWVTLLHIAKTRGDHTDVEDIFKEGIRYSPRSSRLYAAYYDALSPKWVGSSARRSGLNFTIRASFYDNPAFGWIETIKDKEKAWDLLWRGQHQQALDLFDDVIRRRPDFGSRRGRGLALYHLGRFEDSLEELLRVLAMDPGNAQTYADIARVQSWQRSTRDKAFESMRMALNFDPYDPEHLVQRATLYLNRAQHEKAKVDLDKALLFGAYDDDVRDARRRYFWSVKQMDKAIREAERAIQLVPNRSRNWFSYAITLQQNRDCRALGVFDRYLRMCRKRAECGEQKQRQITASIYSMQGACN